MFSSVVFRGWFFICYESEFADMRAITENAMNVIVIWIQFLCKCFLPLPFAVDFSFVTRVNLRTCVQLLKMLLKTSSRAFAPQAKAVKKAPHAIKNSNQSLRWEFVERFAASRKHIETSLVKISCILVHRFTSYRQAKFKENFWVKNGNSPLAKWLPVRYRASNFDKILTTCPSSVVVDVVKIWPWLVHQ
jgi:hypothetical protein